MTAMMGLQTRLMLARTLVWVGLQSSPQTLAGLVSELCAKSVDLVVVVQPGARDDDLLLGYQTASQASAGRAVIGLAAGARLARRARADLVAFDASKPQARAHVHALALAVASDGLELERAFVDDDVDAVVVTPALVAVAAVLAPASAKDSKPWFAQAASLAEAQTLIAAGARRLAVELPPPGSGTGFVTSPGDVVADCRAALAASWRDEMEVASFAAFKGGGPATRGRSFASALPDGSAPGRPVPDAPLAKAQPRRPEPKDQINASAHEDDWSSPAHHEKSPDDHW